MNENLISKEFVVKANVLLEKIEKDSFVCQRFHTSFNKDKTYIAGSLTICNSARIAEEEYEKETKEASEAKAEFEKKYDAARFNYKKHTSFLKLLLKYDVKKQMELGLTGREEPKSKEEWFARAMGVYDRIIGDSGAAELMKTFNFTLSDLRQGRYSIVEARDANITLAKESAEAKSAIVNKDVAFTALYDRVQIIQLCCYYILKESPEKYEELGLPIIDNEIGALITMVKDSSTTKDMVKDSSITKDMVKDSSITKAAETNPMVKDSSITKRKNKSATKKEK